MQGRPGWSTEELAGEADITPVELEPLLETMRSAGLVSRSPKGNWRALGAPKATASGSTDEWGHRTRMLIYSPELLADCPEFTRNTFLHFVEDELAHFRLRDYRDGMRIEVKNVKGITLSRDLEAAYPRLEVEFDEDEANTPLTDNAFWEKRIEAHNLGHKELLDRSAAVAMGGNPEGR